MSAPMSLACAAIAGNVLVFDALYDIARFMAVPVMALKKQRLPAWGQWFGLTYVMPLPYYPPGRRYINIAVPFLLAFVLPLAQRKPRMYLSAGLAIAFFGAVQITDLYR